MEIKLYTNETKKFFKILPFLVEAYYDNSRHITIKELSELSGLNIQGNFLSMLVHAKIMINTKSGERSSLGYVFLRDPKDISAFEVLQAMQGIPYILCSSEWFVKTGELCPVCRSMTVGLEKAIEALRNLSLYDYANSVK